MSNPTSNYSFVMPTSTDLVKDLPADFEVFGQAVDTQMKTNADAAIAKSIVDAKGDLIAATAADTVSRLAVGTNGQVLTADSAEATGVKWATSASGGLTLLSTTTLSGSTTTISSISTAYKQLYAIFHSVSNSTGNSNVTMKFNGDGTTVLYSYYSLGGSQSGTDFNYQSAADKILVGLGVAPSTTQAQQFSGDISLPNYTSTGTKIVKTNSRGTNLTPTNYGSTVNAIYVGTSAITSISLTLSSGTFSTGTVLLYGVN